MTEFYIAQQDLTYRVLEVVADYHFFEYEEPTAFDEWILSLAGDFSSLGNYSLGTLAQVFSLDLVFLEHSVNKLQKAGMLEKVSYANIADMTLSLLKLTDTGRKFAEEKKLPKYSYPQPRTFYFDSMLKKVDDAKPGPATSSDLELEPDFYDLLRPEVETAFKNYFADNFKRDRLCVLDEQKSSFQVTDRVLHKNIPLVWKLSLQAKPEVKAQADAKFKTNLDVNAAQTQIQQGKSASEQQSFVIPVLSFTSKKASNKELRDWVLEFAQQEDYRPMASDHLANPVKQAKILPNPQLLVDNLAVNAKAELENYQANLAKQNWQYASLHSLQQASTSADFSVAENLIPSELAVANTLFADVVSASLLHKELSIPTGDWVRLVRAGGEVEESEQAISGSKQLFQRGLNAGSADIKGKLVATVLLGADADGLGEDFVTLKTQNLNSLCQDASVHASPDTQGLEFLPQLVSYWIELKRNQVLQEEICCVPVAWKNQVVQLELRLLRKLKVPALDFFVPAFAQFHLDLLTLLARFVKPKQFVAQLSEVSMSQVKSLLERLGTLESDSLDELNFEYFADKIKLIDNQEDFDAHLAFLGVPEFDKVAPEFHEQLVKKCFETKKYSRQLDKLGQLKDELSVYCGADSVMVKIDYQSYCKIEQLLTEIDRVCETFALKDSLSLTKLREEIRELQKGVDSLLLPPQDKKIVVLDTNVLIDFSDELSKLEQYRIVLPTTVLDELDKHKGKRNDQFKRIDENIAFLEKKQARETNKAEKVELEKEIKRLKKYKLRQNLAKEAQKANNALQKINFQSEKYEDKLVACLTDDSSPDDQIIATALKYKFSDVVFVSADRNACAKAKGFGLEVRSDLKWVKP